MAVHTDTKGYLPFASGRVVEVVLSPHEDERIDRPLKPYALYDAGVEMVRTADCAGEIAFWLASEDRAISKKYSIGYQLQDLPLDASITGGSGGLVMVLSFYCELTSLAVGQFAATGALAGIRNDKVLKVDGVVGKLEGAWECLDHGAKLLIPAENSADVPSELAERLSLKSISLHPVSTVREAIDVLKGDAEKKDKKEKKSFLTKPLLVAAGLVLCTVIAYTIVFRQENKSLEQSVVQEEVTNAQELHAEPVPLAQESSDVTTSPDLPAVSPQPSPVLDKGFE